MTIAISSSEGYSRRMVKKGVSLRFVIVVEVKMSNTPNNLPKYFDFDRIRML